MDRTELEASSLHFAGFVLDQARACLQGADGAEIALRPKAFDLLLLLARNAGRVMAKDALLDAVWPGVHVSEDSLFQAVREARRAIDDEAGTILRSVAKRGYMLDVAVRQNSGAHATASPALTPPDDRPSLVVLPFANVGGDPEQGYFADGVSEEITMALARFRSFLVIAPASAAAFRDQPPDVREIGRILGVRYVLEGSVRRAGERLRISGRLVEAATGAHLWDDRFEGAAEDLFAMQDRVTEAAAAALEPRIRQAEIDRAQRKPTQDLSAYDLYLRALPYAHEQTRADNEAAMRLLEQALARDPSFARACATLAATTASAIYQGWSDDYRAQQARAQELARRTLAMNSADPVVLSKIGYVLSLPPGELEFGRSLLARATELGPNLADAWHFAGWTSLWAGDLDLAANALDRAERLDPLSPDIARVWTGRGALRFFSGRPEVAIGVLRRAVARSPDWPPPRVYLFVSLVAAGALDDARNEARALLRIQPNRTIRRTRETNAYRPPWMMEMLLDAMRRAGVPEE
ncbi:MAG: winged helix-turn-helix domain-containing protein [Acetobacteraceae bacterium]|nr:winged helix-turn-helix domain-containing protein [Acetobacteraceae bacterium]